jgi:hypothetical protein
MYGNVAAHASQGLETLVLSGVGLLYASMNVVVLKLCTSQPVLCVAQMPVAQITHAVMCLSHCPSHGHKAAATATIEKADWLATMSQWTCGSYCELATTSLMLSASALRVTRLLVHHVAWYS